MQIQTVALNVVPNGVPPIIEVTQNDNGRIIQIALKNGSAAYTLQSRYTYTLCGTKPTGTGFSYDDAVSVIGTNILSFNTNTVMTAVAGDVRCGIIIYDGDEHVETLNFILRVQRTALDTDTIIDSSDFGSIISQAVVDWMNEHGVVIDASATAETLPAGSSATASFEDGVFTFGIPKGDTGTAGADAVMYVLEPSVSVIVYDPNAEEGARLTPAELTLTAYQIVNGARTAFGADTIEISYYNPETTYGWGASQHIDSLRLNPVYSLTANLPSGITPGAEIVASMENRQGVVAQISIAVVSSGVNGAQGPKGDTGEVSQVDFDALSDDVDDLKSAIALGGSFNAEVKSALETLLEHVAYIDANGQTYLDALHTAMYPPANLTRITAVYTQSGTVYDTDTLNSLKADLVVTAFYDNGTSEIVSTYTLSGTLTVGTSAITVSYGGKTTTFNVAVTEYVDTFTYGLVDNSSAITGSYITDTGEIETATQQSGYYEDYIDLYGISSVVIHYVKSAGTINYRINVYDANKVFTRQLHPTGNAYETVTLQSGERYIRLGWYLDSTSYTCKFYIQSTSPTALQMEIGDISGSTGEDTSSSVRVRSTGYIPASGSITIEDCPWEIWSNWTGVTGGGYFFRCYDSSKTIVGTLIGTNNQMYREDQKNLTLPTNTAYVRMELQKAGSTDISSGFTANTHPFAIDGVSYQVTEE